MRIRKTLSALFLSLGLVGIANAGPIKEKQAIEIAKDFFSTSLRSANSQNEFKVSYSEPNVRLSASALRSSNGETENLFYVINRGNNNGYVVVAGDDRVAPIFGYSREGSLDVKAIERNTNLRYMLDTYAEQVYYALQNVEDKAIPAGTLRAGTRLSSEEIEIEPLLEVETDRVTRRANPIQWGQDWPFNLYAPNININGRSYPTVSGCVATAICTVMRWHAWPQSPKGQTAYNWRGNWLSLDFDREGKEYDWDNMPITVSGRGYDRSTGRILNDVQADNIGRLLRDIGYSIRMSYGTAASGGSGTQVYYAPKPLVENFSYHKDLKWIQRSDYRSSARWIEEIRSEMNNYGPVIYAGFSSGGGHCFVLDGLGTHKHSYRDGSVRTVQYAHVDWGWNGSENGWYALDILEPGSQGIGGGSGGYSRGQQMLRYVRPDRDNQPQPRPQPNKAKFELKVTGHNVKNLSGVEFTKDSKLSLSVNVQNVGKKEFNYDLAIYATKRGTDAFTNPLQIDRRNQYIGANSNKTVTFYPNLSDIEAGEYDVYIAYAESADQKSGGRYFRNSDGKTITKVATLSVRKKQEPKPDPKPEPTPTPKKENFDLSIVKAISQTVTKGRNKITIEVENKGDRGYYNRLALLLASNSNQEQAPIIATSTPYIMSGSKSLVTFDVDFSNTEAGDYLLYVAYRKDNSTWKSIEQLAGNIKIKAKEDAKPKPKVQNYDLYLSRYTDHLTVRKGAKTMIPVYVTNTGGKSYNDRIAMYFIPKRQDGKINWDEKLKVIEKQYLLVNTSEELKMEFYPELQNIPVGSYNIVVTYISKGGAVNYLSAAGKTQLEPVGTIDIIDNKKEEASTTPTVSPKLVYFYQDGKYIGQDYSKIKYRNGKSSFIATVYLDAPVAYNGPVRIAITEYSDARKIVSYNYLDRNVRLEANKDSYISVSFSTKNLVSRYFKISVHYKVGKQWMVVPSKSVPFYMDFQAYGVAEDDNAQDTDLTPTKGGTYMELEARSTVIGEPIVNRGNDIDASNTSIDDVEVVKAKMYPTVVEAIATINVDKATDANIYNVSGQKVATIKLIEGVNNVDLSYLAQGSYLITIDNETIRFIRK